MTAVRNRKRAWFHFVMAGALLAGFLFFRVGRAEAPQAAGQVSPKLTALLADMVRSVSQTPAEAPAARTAPDRGFSMESMPPSVRDAARHRMLRVNSKAEVQVYILLDAVTGENLRQLEAHGVTVEIPDAAHRRVQARIPVARLQAVAELPFVNFIRLPSYAIRLTGAVNTEGDAIHRADQVRAQFQSASSKIDGRGVRVGVISDGIKGIFATGCTTCSGVAGGPISTGDLPGATGTRNLAGVLTSSGGGINGRSFASNNDLEGIIPGCGFAGAGAEGTALLEIIHDLAPGAQLSFANADTDLAFANAVNFLAASNDVVTDDLGFLGLPYDGTSGVSANTASALNSPANAIRGYFTAAGNFADEHYYGTYTSSGVNENTISGITTSGNLHLFQSSADTVDTRALGPKPYNLVLLPAGGQVVVFLTWDDPFGASNNNYDLYLVRQSTNAVVARSTDVQRGTQDPLEFLSYVNSTGSQDYFRIVVQNVGNAAAARHLNLFSFQPECATDGPRRLAPPRHERLNFNTATRSVPAQSDSGGSPVSVVSVGAICSASDTVQTFFGSDTTRDESCFDPDHSTIEFFSSLGPTLDGRTKPDVSGIDGVSITGAGNFPCDATSPNCHDPFFGTSAAAPHLAGVAALVLQSAPCLREGSSGALDDTTARTNLRNLLLDNAVPLGGVIPNNTFGFGRADALASVQETLPRFTGTPTITVGGDTPTGKMLSATQLGFDDPNSCPLTTLNWTGGCGAGPAASMNCPFGPHDVTVSASNNGAAFSSPVDVHIVVTDFVVAASPASQTVAAGGSANFTVTVSAQGGTYGDPVTLACTGLPAGTSCTFNPPTVTPGATSAVSNLTITTTARPAAAVRFRSPGSASNLPLGHGTTPGGVWLAVAAFTLLGLLAARSVSRPRLNTLIAAIVMLTIFALQAACGGGGGGNRGTTAGTYDIGITGTVGTLAHSGTIKLTVQ